MKYAMEGWYRDGEICHSECVNAFAAYAAFFGLMQSGRVTRIIATGEDGNKLFDAFFPAGDGMETFYSISPEMIAEMTAAAGSIVSKNTKRQEREILDSLPKDL